MTTAVDDVDAHDVNILIFLSSMSPTRTGHLCDHFPGQFWTVFDFINESSADTFCKDIRQVKMLQYL